jgi:RNA polymerase sigma factor (sigma-70 family)
MESLKENPCKQITDGNSGFLQDLIDRDKYSIVNMVKTNHGSEQDGDDVFQDALMIIFQKCREGKLQLTASLNTFLFAVARNLWRSRLRRTRLINLPAEDDENDFAVDNISVYDDTNHQRKRLFAKYFSQLNEKCQQCLQLHFEGIKGEEIAARLGYNSYEYYRVAKNRCLESLKKMIQGDELFKEIKANSHE